MKLNLQGLSATSLLLSTSLWNVVDAAHNHINTHDEYYLKTRNQLMKETDLIIGKNGIEIIDEIGEGQRRELSKTSEETDDSEESSDNNQKKTSKKRVNSSKTRNQKSSKKKMALANSGDSSDNVVVSITAPVETETESQSFFLKKDIDFTSPQIMIAIAVIGGVLLVSLITSVAVKKRLKSSEDEDSKSLASTFQSGDRSTSLSKKALGSSIRTSTPAFSIRDLHNDPEALPGRAQDDEGVPYFMRGTRETRSKKMPPAEVFHL
jgi:hypothetical protein